MRKQILKFFFILLSVFFLQSCQEEDLERSEASASQQTDIIDKIITLDDLARKDAVIDKLKSISVEKGLYGNKSSNYEDYEILTDSIRLIEFDGDETYTFQIIRTSNVDKNEVENLIIKDVNDSTTAYIIRYKFSELGMQNLKDNLSTQGLIDKIQLQFLDYAPSALMSRGSSALQGVYYQGSCWAVTDIWEDSNGDVWYDIVPCPLCSCGSGSSSGSSGGMSAQYMFLEDLGISGGNGGAPVTGGPGGPGGSGPPSNSSGDINISSPPAVTAPLALDSNIRSLNSITNRPEVKAKILQLKAGVTTVAMEQGAEFFTNDNSSLPLIQEDLTPNPQGIQFGLVMLNSILRIHSHDHPALEPVFSADDIYKMASFYKEKRQMQAPDADNISSILVSNLGIFALRVTDPVKAKTFGDRLFNSAYLKLFTKNYQERVRDKANSECNCVLPNDMYEKYLSNNLVDFLVKQDSGLTLYKPTVKQDGSLSWSILGKMN